MTNLLKKAFQETSELGEGEQNTIASAILAVLKEKKVVEDEEDEKEWDDMVQSEFSQKWLEKMTLEVKEEIRKGETLELDPSDLLK